MTRRPSDERSLRVRRGFTLIELLVVISIIALLIAILLPALGAARDRAVVTQCLSQLRHAGTAFYNYANDNNDFLPEADNSAAEKGWAWRVDGVPAIYASGGWTHYSIFLLPYLSMDPNALAHPTRPIPDQAKDPAALPSWFFNYWNSQGQTVTTEDEERGWKIRNLSAGHYIQVKQRSGDGNWGAGLRLGDTSDAGHALHDRRLDRASQTALLFEGLHEDHTRFGREIGLDDAGDSTNNAVIVGAHIEHSSGSDFEREQAVHGRHPGGRNGFLFGDGHAEAANVREMREQKQEFMLDPVIAGAHHTTSWTPGNSYN